MQNWLSRITRVRYDYDDVSLQERARVLVAVSLGLAGLNLLFGLVSILTGLSNPSAALGNWIFIWVLVNIGLILTYGLTQSGRASLAGALLVASLMMVTFVADVGDGVSANTGIIGWAIPIVLAGILFSPRFAFFAATVSVILLGGLGLLEWQRTPVGARLALQEELIFSIGISGIILYSIVLITSFFVRNIQRRAQEALQRTVQLRATSRVSQAAAMTQDLAELMDEVVSLISRLFDYYHVQIFLLDPQRESALLRAATGEAGRQLLARRHSVVVGSPSVIGQVTARGEPVLVPDVSVDPTQRQSELLPNTRSEAALPLHVGDRVVGALSVHSLEPNAFNPEDVETLQVLANQLAVAMENTRLLDEVTRRATENERLLRDAQASLRQIEDLNRSLTRQGWREYLRLRAKGAAQGYTLQAGRISEDARWTLSMQAAFEDQHVIMTGDGEQPDKISLPLRVRDEVIGVLEVERGGEQVWTADQMALAEALAERLSLALDNARLFEQADSLARREQFVNEITQSVQQAENVDAVLQSALVELGRVLGASRGVVQLSPKRQPPRVDEFPSIEDGNGGSVVSSGGMSEDEEEL